MMLADQLVAEWARCGVLFGELQVKLQARQGCWHHQDDETGLEKCSVPIVYQAGRPALENALHIIPPALSQDTLP